MDVAIVGSGYTGSRLARACRERGIQPDKLRVAHLETIRTPTLILQGVRDALGNRAEIESARTALEKLRGDKAKAEMKDGVLEIVLPKVEATTPYKVKVA